MIVVISDGNDNLSDHALSDAIDAAIRAEAAVYTVSTNTDWLAMDDRSKPQKIRAGRRRQNPAAVRGPDRRAGLFPLPRRRPRRIVPRYRNRVAQPVFHRLRAQQSAGR